MYKGLQKTLAQKSLRSCSVGPSCDCYVILSSIFVHCVLFRPEPPKSLQRSNQKHTPRPLRMGRGVLLTSNLPQLQNLIKRDPIAYREEFLQQWNHYNSICQIFKINPDEQAEHYRELVSFISQVKCIRYIVTGLSDYLSGRDMLSARDCRISLPNNIASVRKLWHACSRHPKKSCTKLGFASQQRCHHFNRVRISFSTSEMASTELIEQFAEDIVSPSLSNLLIHTTFIHPQNDFV